MPPRCFAKTPDARWAPQGGSGFADQTQKRETGSAQPAGSGGTVDDDVPFE